MFIHLALELMFNFPGYRNLGASEANYYTLSSSDEAAVDFSHTSELESSLTATFRLLRDTESIIRGLELGDSIVALTAGNGGVLNVLWCNGGSQWELDLGRLFRVSQVDVEVLHGSSLFTSQHSPFTIKFRKANNQPWARTFPV